MFNGGNILESAVAFFVSDHNNPVGRHLLKDAFVHGNILA
jgi:hypothetical protein